MRHLNLQNNKITCFKNLNHLNLLTLILNNNEIDTFEEGEDVGLKTLSTLLKFQISNNRLTTLRLFENVSTLQSLCVVGNLISDITELYYLRSLLSLSELDLRQNMLCSQPHYYDFCIFNLPSLLFLDGDYVDPQTKVYINILFIKQYQTNSYLQVHAHVKFKTMGNEFMPIKLTSFLILTNQLNFPSISPYDLCIDEQPPKIVIFVGPPASFKGQLVKQICDLKKKYAGKYTE